MSNLVRTEWLKLRKYWAFWGMIVLIALAYPGINFIVYQFYREVLQKENTAGMLAKMYLGNPFAFPEVWHTAAFASSLFVIIPAMCVIMFITNEYTYKTHRQNIIDGWSRNTFMSAKMIDVVIISLLVTLVYMITAYVIGSKNEAPQNASMWSKFYFAGLFLLQTFSQLSIAFLVGFLVRKAFIALGIFVFYFFPLEPLLIGLTQEKFKIDLKYMPLEISDRMIPVPGFLGRLDYESYQARLAVMNEHIFYTIGFTALVWGLCYWINKRRDF